MRPITFVCPSRWLASCAKSSVLLQNQRIEVIANPIDTRVWRPIDRSFSRQVLGLPEDARIILFGALDPAADANKGADLFLSSLRAVSAFPKTEIVLFGQSAPREPVPSSFPVRYLGVLRDDLSLVLAYSAADVMVVPSRQEAFGQTALEAHACGVPVVAFEVGGLRDIVEHRTTGYLAKPFDAEDLATGINWILESGRRNVLGAAARTRVQSQFSAEAIAGKYLDLYSDVLRAVTPEEHLHAARA
jgi:glycosyltransferase involved in cell wall biosynthesis